MPVTFPFLLVGPRFFLERRRHPQACEELNIHEEIEAGCFLTGHPQIKEPLSGAALGFADDRVYLFGVGGAPLGSVSYESVHWVSVEAHADVLKRFSEARLMLLGHKQLSFRARQTTEAWYVVVEWKGPQGSPHDGIFCFEGLAADSRARAVADAILHYADCHRQVSGRSGHERFNQSLDAFEARRCEHCGKMHRPSGSSQKPQAA